MTTDIDNNIDRKESNMAEKGTTFQIIVFRLGNQEYALSIDQIKEVVITPNIARVPLTQPYIKGVANVRGNVLAILDLAERFNIEKSETVNHESHKYTLVVSSDEFKMGVLVKEVPKTLRITESDIDASPNIIHDNASESNYIKAIVKSGNRMIMLIDIFKVITREDKDLLSKTA